MARQDFERSDRRPSPGGVGECGAPVSDCSTHGPYVRHLNEAGAGRDEGVESCGQFREVVPPKRAALPHRCLTRRRAYPSQRIFLSGSSAPGRPRRSIDPVDHLLTGVGKSTTPDDRLVLVNGWPWGRGSGPVTGRMPVAPAESVGLMLVFGRSVSVMAEEPGRTNRGAQLSGSARIGEAIKEGPRRMIFAS